MHDFYDPVNLQRLHTALPLLHSQLEKILMQIHECWQFLVSDPAPPNEDRILSVLDLVDLLDCFSELCKRLRMEKIAKDRGKWIDTRRSGYYT